MAPADPFAAGEHLDPGSMGRIAPFPAGGAGTGVRLPRSQRGTNLRLMARYCGLPDADADAALEAAGLVGAADQRYSTYSLGIFAGVLTRRRDVTA